MTHGLITNVMSSHESKEIQWLYIKWYQGKEGEDNMQQGPASLHWNDTEQEPLNYPFFQQGLIMSTFLLKFILWSFGFKMGYLYNSGSFCQRIQILSHLWRRIFFNFQPFRLKSLWRKEKILEPLKWKKNWFLELWAYCNYHLLSQVFAFFCMQEH